MAWVNAALNSLCLIEYSVSFEFNFVHAVAANKRTDSHNFKHIFKFTYNDSLCHLKLNRDRSSWVNRRKITKCSWRKHPLDSHVPKISWKPFKLPLSLPANENVSVKPLSLICITSIFYTIHSLKHFSVYEGSCGKIIALNHSSSFSKHLVKCLKKTKILFTSLGWSVLYILDQLTIIF